MVDTLTSLLLIFGSLFVLVAGVGVFRFKETLFRAHAISKALTLGLTCILLALFALTGSLATGTKVVLAIIFQFITIPIAAHIFALYAIHDIKK